MRVISKLHVYFVADILRTTLDFELQSLKYTRRVLVAHNGLDVLKKTKMI